MCKVPDWQMGLSSCTRCSPTGGLRNPRRMRSPIFSLPSSRRPRSPDVLDHLLFARAGKHGCYELHMSARKGHSLASSPRRSGVGYYFRSGRWDQDAVPCSRTLIGPKSNIANPRTAANCRVGTPGGDSFVSGNKVGSKPPPAGHNKKCGSSRWRKDLPLGH